MGFSDSKSADQCHGLVVQHIISQFRFDCNCIDGSYFCHHVSPYNEADAGCQSDARAATQDPGTSKKIR